MSGITRKLAFLEFREKAKLGLPALILVVVGFWITAQFVEPAPPRHIVLACGPLEGAYYAYGQQYRDLIEP